MNKPDLALNNLQWLICHKTKATLSIVSMAPFLILNSIPIFWLYILIFSINVSSFIFCKFWGDSTVLVISHRNSSLSTPGISLLKLTSNFYATSCLSQFISRHTFAQSAGAVEFTDCTSAEG